MNIYAPVEIAFMGVYFPVAIPLVVLGITLAKLTDYFLKKADLIKHIWNPALAVTAFSVSYSIIITFIIKMV